MNEANLAGMCARTPAALLGRAAPPAGAVGKAQAAVDRGDLDSAVAFYRQALASAPNRVDLRIALERYTRMAAEAHVKRARDLEAQNQLNGALAEYRLAADLDTTSTAAAAKAAEIERRIRDQIDATRPRPRIDDLRQQAAAHVADSASRPAHARAAHAVHQFRRARHPEFGRDADRPEHRLRPGSRGDA